MNERTRFGLYLLFPPFLLWAVIILLIIDSTLAQYVYDRINTQLMGIVILIAGLIFPGAAFFVGVSGLREKLDTRVNLMVTLFSGLMLLLLAGLLLIYR